MRVKGQVQGLSEKLSLFNETNLPRFFARKVLFTLFFPVNQLPARSRKRRASYRSSFRRVMWFHYRTVLIRAIMPVSSSFPTFVDRVSTCRGNFLWHAGSRLKSISGERIRSDRRRTASQTKRARQKSRNARSSPEAPLEMHNEVKSRQLSYGSFSIADSSPRASRYLTEEKRRNNN